MTTRSCETSSGPQASLVSGSSELLTRSASNPGDLASGPIVLGAAANSFPLSVTHSCHGKHITDTKLTQKRHVSDTYRFSKRPEKYAIDTKNTKKNKILNLDRLPLLPGPSNASQAALASGASNLGFPFKDAWALVLPHVAIAGIIRQKTPVKPHYPQKATWWRRISFVHLLSRAVAVRSFQKIARSVVVRSQGPTTACGFFSLQCPAYLP